MALQFDEHRAPCAPEVGASVRHLLVAYSATLDAVDRLPLVPMVAVGWRWRWPKRGPLRLPRLSLTAHSLTVRHIDRVLAAAERSLLRRVALGVAAQDDVEALESVRAFRASLPSRSWALRTSALVIAVLVVARALAGLAPDFHSVISLLPGIQESSVSSVLDSTLGAFDAGSSSIGSAVGGLFNASLATLTIGAVLLLMAAYLVLRPVMSAFRLKRLVFNLYPHADTALRYVPASWSVSRATGVYALEREAFAALGRPAPVEVPLDLIVPLPLAVAGLGAIVAYSVVVPSEPEPLSLPELLSAVAGYGCPPVLRIVWLASTWRARRGGHRSQWLLTDDVVVSWSSTPVRCRSPVLIAAISFYAFPFVGFLWWSTATDLLELGLARDVPLLKRIKPRREGLVVSEWFFVLPVLWLCIALSRVRAAQVAVGRRPLSPLAGLLVFVWPALCLLLQRELNDVWEDAGTSLDTSELVALACASNVS